MRIATINVFPQGFEWNDSIDMQLSRSSISQVDASKTRSLLPASSSLERYVFLLVHAIREQQLCVLLIPWLIVELLFVPKEKTEQQERYN